MDEVTKTSNAGLLLPVSVLYLVLPNLLFAYGWLKLPFAIITIAITLIYILVAFQDVYEYVRSIWLRGAANTNYTSILKSYAWIIPSCLLILVWLFLSGAGGFGFQTDDYHASNALLKELVFQPWPLTISINGTLTNIVYYSGYYLPAAAIGQILGWVAANLFLFLWTVVGVFLSFIWFCRVSRVRLNSNAARLFALTLIFCLAGGLDYLGAFLLHRGSFSFTAAWQFWAEYFQYSSNTTLIYWVPQQAIAGWIVISIIVNYLYQGQPLKYLGAVVTACILWSPFSVVGITPFLLLILAVYLSSNNRSHLFNRVALALNLGSIWIGVINLLYVGSNQFKFPSGWLWNLVDNHIKLIDRTLLFWFIQFAFLALLIIIFLVLGILLAPKSAENSADSRISRWLVKLKQQFDIVPMQLILVIVGLVVLVILPFYKLGIYNDLVMRSSIPALFIFWAFVGKVMIDSLPVTRARLLLLYAAIMIVLGVGFLPALAEINESILTYHFGPPSLSSVTSEADANTQQIVEERAGNASSFFYRYISK